MNSKRWASFANDFATDMAPIVVLFGKQATKQFLSESTKAWDCIIFGMAPIGIITAIVSVIRLYGSDSLRAFIGRAQGPHAAAEAELCSSTSDDGAAPYSSPPTCGIHLAEDFLSTTSEWCEIDSKGQPLGHAASSGGEEQTPQRLAPHPNLSFNTGIKAISQWRLRLVAMVGFLLQLSFFIYANWATFYSTHFSTDESPPRLRAVHLAEIGTLLINVGMILCAILIERLSMEWKFCAVSEPTSRIFWLQPGGQRVGDQLFNPFAYSKVAENYITSGKLGWTATRLWPANSGGTNLPSGLPLLRLH
ncbi:hypothetical protein RB595_008760 [Gaeumannomyces hyphopodioides]